MFPESRFLHGFSDKRCVTNSSLSSSSFLSGDPNLGVSTLISELVLWSGRPGAVARASVYSHTARCQILTLVGARDVGGVPEV